MKKNNDFISKRIVLPNGILINGFYFFHTALYPFVSKTVEVRIDKIKPKEAKVFTLNGKFICTAKFIKKVSIRLKKIKRKIWHLRYSYSEPFALCGIKEKLSIRITPDTKLSSIKDLFDSTERPCNRCKYIHTHKTPGAQ